MSALVPANHSPDNPEPTNGSVNSRCAHSPHPGHLSAIGHLVGSSLRSKRFRLVSEQRNTEEGDFRF